MLAAYDKFTNRLAGKIFYNMHTHHTKHEQGRLEINEIKSNQILKNNKMKDEKKWVGETKNNDIEINMLQIINKIYILTNINHKLVVFSHLNKTTTSSQH